MIKITNDYYIDTDPRNWILYKKYVIEEKDLKKCKKAKVGDERYEAIGYFPTLESLLKYLLEREKRDLAKSFEFQELQKFVEACRRMQNKFIEDVKVYVSEIDVDTRKDYLTKKMGVALE